MASSPSNRPDEAAAAGHEEAHHIEGGDEAADAGGTERRSEASGDAVDDARGGAALESGPEFDPGERVLCTDARRARDDPGDGRPPPLYEAVVRSSGLKRVDRTSGKILPEPKKGGRRRGRYRPHEHYEPPPENSVKEWCHLVHFQGWNSRWDRWMTERDVFRDTPKNRQRVEGTTTAGAARAPSKPSEKKGRKRGRSLGEDESSAAIYRRNLKLVTKACKLPFTLQTILVDDRDSITKIVYPPFSYGSKDDPVERIKRGISMLHRLPKSVTVIDVLGRYVRAKKGEDLEEFAREQQRQREIPKVKPPPSLKETQETTAASAREAAGDAAGQDGASQLGKENPGDEQKQLGGDEDGGAGNEEVQRSAAACPKNNKEQKWSFSSRISTKEILKLRKKKRKKFALTVVALVDVSLPLFLLYREEQEQYMKFMGCDGGGDDDDGDKDPGKEEGAGAGGAGGGGEGSDGGHGRRPSEVFGAEHLLRFLVKLPFLLSQHDPPAGGGAGGPGDGEGSDPYVLASEEKTREFADCVAELIIFLQTNLECFKRKYRAVERRPCLHCLRPEPPGK